MMINVTMTMVAAVLALSAGAHECPVLCSAPVVDAFTPSGNP